MMKKVTGAVIAAVLMAANVWAGPVDEMLDADRAFSALAQKDGVETAFAAYAADDVRMFPDGGAPYSGRDALLARFSNWPEGAMLSWSPKEGVAASSGDFGYTWGTFVFTAQGDDGEISEYGKYVSIWRKNEIGEWKFIADIGNKSPAPESRD